MARLFRQTVKAFQPARACQAHGSGGADDRQTLSPTTLEPKEQQVIHIRKFLAIAALGLIGLSGTSMFGVAHADWVRGSSGTSYERAPNGAYTGNYGK